MTEKLLIEVNDSVELFLYEGILKKNNIPYIIKRPGMRSYTHILLGQSHAVPAEIYVNESDFKQARDFTAIVNLEKGDNPMEKGTQANKRKMMLAWVIVALFLVPLLVLALIELLK
jgi:hypothetical protein